MSIPARWWRERDATKSHNADVVVRACRVASAAHDTCDEDVEQAIELIDEADEAATRGSYHKALRLLKRAVECCVGVNPTNRFNRRMKRLQEQLR